MVQRPPWLSAQFTQSNWNNTPGAGPQSSVANRDFLLQGGSAPRVPTSASGLDPQGWLSGSPFSKTSSSLAYGQIGQNQQIGQGIPNFGQGDTRNSMLGNFVNFGTPNRRSYDDPRLSSTPLERFKLQQQQILERAPQTFWPSGRAEPVNNAKNPGQTAGGVAAGNKLSSPSGSGTHGPWENLNRWDAEILAAVGTVESVTGIFIPPNMVKAIMMVESQGQPNAEGPGTNYGTFKGLMQVNQNGSNTSAWDGEIDWSRVWEPGYNILIGTIELASWYNSIKFGTNPLTGEGAPADFNWTDVAGGHFAGWGYRDRTRTDQLSSVGQYRGWFEENMATLGSALDETGGRGVTADIGIMWGHQDFGYSQPFGLTDFALSPQGRAWYEHYALDENGNYIGHPALDVSMPIGTPLYAPVSGTVHAVGGLGYEKDDLGDYPYTGSFQIITDDGYYVHMGHMRSIDNNLKIGDRIEPGMYVGTSGTAGSGPHLHIEVREYKPHPYGDWIFHNPESFFSGGLIYQGREAQSYTENLIPGLPTAPRQAGAGALPFWLRF